MVDKSSQSSDASDAGQTEPQNAQGDGRPAKGTAGPKAAHAKGRARKPKFRVQRPHSAEMDALGSGTSQIDTKPADDDESGSTTIGLGFVGEEPPDDPNYVAGKILPEGAGDSIFDELDRQKKRVSQLTAHENNFERAAIMARRILTDLAAVLHDYTGVVDAVSRSLRLANDLRKTIVVLDLATRAIHEHRNKGAKHRVVNYIVAAPGVSGPARDYSDPPVPAAKADIPTQYFERIIDEINDAQAGVSDLERALYAEPDEPEDAWLENCRLAQRYLIEAQVACNKAFDYHRAGGAKTTAIEHEKVAANCNSDLPPADDAVRAAG